MAKDSKIEWCHHTKNFWSGCTEVSPACAYCYARVLAKRNKIFGQWGKGAPRAKHDDGAAEEIARWNAKAGNVAALCERRADEKPPRPRVFLNSMSDWLDGEVPIEWLAKLLDSIRLAKNLDFILLTKRPENFFTRVEAAGCSVEETNENLWAWIGNWAILRQAPSNVWIGTTAENQQWADKRREHLKAIPAVHHFVSYEPALGPVDWTGWEFLKWLISGGESGGKARPSHPDWHRAARDFCQKHGIAYFFKQWGEWSPSFDVASRPAFAIANDGTFYRMTDLALDGSRRAECMRNGHDRQNLTCIYRLGKDHTGRLLDGIEHSAFPNVAGTIRPRPSQGQPVPESA